MLSHTRVIKVVCSGSHTAALTALGKVYTWGLNEKGQLGHQHSPYNKPQPLTLPGQGFAYDIAVTSYATFVLMTSSSQSSLLVAAGNIACLNDESDSSSLVVKITAFDQIQHPISIHCSNDHMIIVSNPNPCVMYSINQRLLEKCRCWMLRMIDIQELLIKPLISNDALQSLPPSPALRAFKQLTSSFAAVFDQFLLISTQFRHAQIFKAAIEQSDPFQKAERCIHCFYTYLRDYLAFIQLGGPELLGKKLSTFVVQLSPNLLQLDPRHVTSTPISCSQTIGRILEWPVHVVTELSVTIIEMHKLSDSLQAENSRLWLRLKKLVLLELRSLQRTLAVLKHCSHRIADHIRVRGRTILRESRKHPVQLSTAGKFTSHWLILCSDVFLYCQGSSVRGVYPLEIVWVEAVTDTNNIKFEIKLTTPEEVLILQCPNGEEKSGWLNALYSAINYRLLHLKYPDEVLPLSPQQPQRLPLSRSASHSYNRAGRLKDATYSGSWYKAMMNGQGELRWTDGRVYSGKFKDNQEYGLGVLRVPASDGKEDVYTGNWQAAALNGLGSVRYADGSLYEGYFVDGQRSGHGVMKRGTLNSTGCSVYCGSWLRDKQNGYGVLETPDTGQIYLGNFSDGQRHGRGTLVSVDGSYFEGNFVTGKILGDGLLVNDSTVSYEGTFNDSLQINGKGRLTLSDGSVLEATFSGGTLDSGIKLTSGTIWARDTGSKSDVHSPVSTEPKEEGPSCYLSYSVPAADRWTDILSHCRRILGYTTDDQPPSTAQAWSKVAGYVASAKRAMLAQDISLPAADTERLERIGDCDMTNLTLERYHGIKDYLQLAFASPLHPLRKLLDGLVDAFRFSYVGLGCHSRLRPHALAEVLHIRQHIYELVRLFFPALPVEGDVINVYPESNVRSAPLYSDDCRGASSQPEHHGELASSGCLLYPLLLPHIYPALFSLYAIHCEAQDALYWRKLQAWSRLDDAALMQQLGVARRFWCMTETRDNSKQNPAQIRCFSQAIDALQHVSTSFCPAEKLAVIQKCFDQINEAVQSDERVAPMSWSMDELFPVFLFVCIRARLQRLGAELELTEQLTEPGVLRGQNGLLFVTLQACYFQIRHEKLPS